jgi:lipoprotein-anchoring transpeptidase ErfK/SrfK
MDGVAPPPDDVVVSPSEVQYVSTTWEETVLRGRPWVPHKRIATLNSGTRLVVTGEVESRDEKGCKGKKWFAVLPFGYVCSLHVRTSDKRPSSKGINPVDPGRRVPFNYVFVRADETPMYESHAQLETGIPTRTLTKGMSLAVSRTSEFDGEIYVKTTKGEFVPKSEVRWGGQGSKWNGVLLEGKHLGPSFAWAAKAKVAIRDQPNKAGKRVGRLGRRQRVPLLRDNKETGKARFYEIAEDQWVAASDLNEVHIIRPPHGVLSDFRQRETGNDQWIDVDLAEQVLVAYRGDQAVFATLVSSGRSHGTPLGNYPIWAKVGSMDMGNQPYEDRPYLVQGVPWVLLFQGHNALHGAYWHDSFGRKKSHGCVNLAPLDARWVFEWTGPAMREGWSGLLPTDLQRSATVHVRDSSRTEGQRWTQQRRIGPPDRKAEALLAEEASERRAREQVEAAKTANFLPHPENTPPPGAPKRLEEGPPPSLSRLPAGPPEDEKGELGGTSAGH